MAILRWSLIVLGIFGMAVGVLWALNANMHAGYQSIITAKEDWDTQLRCVNQDVVDLWSAINQGTKQYPDLDGLCKKLFLVQYELRIVSDQAVLTDDSGLISIDSNLFELTLLSDSLLTLVHAFHDSCESHKALYTTQLIDMRQNWKRYSQFKRNINSANRSLRYFLGVLESYNESRKNALINAALNYSRLPKCFVYFKHEHEDVLLID